MFQPVILVTDAMLYLLVLLVVLFVFYARRNLLLRESWALVFQRPVAMFSLVILWAFFLVALLDSLHFHPALPQWMSDKIYYSSNVRSLLDVLLSPLGEITQKTYTAPFAISLQPGITYFAIIKLISFDMAKFGLLWIVLLAIVIFRSAKRAHETFSRQFIIILTGKEKIAWRAFFITLGCLLIIAVVTLDLSKFYAIFGTDKIGQDMFYATIKSIRTGVVIGTLATLFMLPFAVLFGTLAGYLGGRVDDIIQYVYTTLSSIPGVLLITASVLALQIFIVDHPLLFPDLASRADARLFILCVILGITSWTDLCRLIRGETLKLREMDFVQAAKVMGVSSQRIIARHIVRNVQHIILITMVLDFSGLVLAEAVLSYVGVGVDPSTMSWGNMINSARMELAREPVVWWPLTAAFTFMFPLVFAANLFSDAIRDAFDPRKSV
jgi:peptide/nickel transport system permease protein